MGALVGYPIPQCLCTATVTAAFSKILTVIHRAELSKYEQHLYQGINNLTDKFIIFPNH